MSDYCDIEKVREAVDISVVDLKRFDAFESRQFSPRVQHRTTLDVNLSRCQNEAISFYAILICFQFSTEKGAHVEWALNIDFHVAAYDCVLSGAF